MIRRHTTPRMSSFGFAALALAAAACANPSDEPTSELDDAVLDAPAVADAEAVRPLTRVTLVDGIAAAENLLITSDHRLFVTGDTGIFEIRGRRSHAQAVLVAPADGCQFAGLVEVRRVLYANCFASPASSVFAAALTREPVFRQITTLPGIILANGLTADAEGRLYIAATFQDQILRLTLSPGDPFQIATSETWLSGTGMFTNGMKFFAGSLFWTDASAIRRVRIGRDGAPGELQTLITQPTFFDDLSVGVGTILVADFLGNQVQAFRRTGEPLWTSGAVLTNPSAVIRAHGRAGLGLFDLVVTEKTANRVSLLVPSAP